MSQLIDPLNDVPEHIARHRKLGQPRQRTLTMVWALAHVALDFARTVSIAAPVDRRVDGLPTADPPARPPLPGALRARGKALERVVQSLLRQGFVEEVAFGLADEAWRSGDDGRFGLRITSVGLKAVGVPALMSGLDVAPGDDQPTATPAQKPPRPGSKLAQLITMLMEPGGRPVEELSQALGWQAHTTRAVISRLQKSGHVVVRTKNDTGQSVYRIEPAADA